MNSNLLSCFCALLLANLALAEPNCLIKKYSLDQAAGCTVTEGLMVNFLIKETLPAQTNCDESKTVCVKAKPIGTTISLGGTFATAITSVAVTGASNTAQIPIVHAAVSQTVATPMVGIFPFTAKVAPADALKFDVAFTATITPGVKLIAETSGTVCTDDNLCFLTDAKTFKLWGTVGTFKSVTVIGANGEKAVVPLIVKAANDVTPSPELLQVPENGILEAYMQVTVPFEATTVAGVGGDLVNKVDCKGNQACYDIIPINAVTFVGVFPAAPLTITLKGKNDQEFISYYFGSASVALKTGILTVATAVVTLFMTA